MKEVSKDKKSLSIKEIDMSKASDKANAFVEAMIQAHERMKQVIKDQKEKYRKEKEE